MPIPASPSAIDSAVTASSSAVRVRPPSAKRTSVTPWRSAATAAARTSSVVRSAIASGGRGEQLVQRALVDDAPGADDRDAVAELLDLAHQVRGQQHRDALIGEPADELPHVAHAARVQARGRLVEQQQPRGADQRGGDAEPLAHAVRVAADAVLAPGRVSSTVSSASSMRRGCAVAVERRDQLEVAAAAEVRVEARRLDEARRRRPARAPPRRGGRARTASRCPRRAGSGRAASAARSSCRRRWGRGSRRRRRRRR